MSRSRLFRGLGIVIVSVSLLVACGTLASGPPQEAEDTITTKRVQVVPGAFIAFDGRSSAPEDTLLQTQLLADDTPVDWWPAEAAARVEAGHWQVRVPLGEQGTPHTLSEEKQYVLRVWEQGNQEVEAQPFAFDVSGPPAPATDEPSSGDVIRRAANVEQVELLIMESFPVQVAAVARGNLRDSCTEIDEVRTNFDAESNTFRVEITTARDREAVCVQVLAPFEKRIDFDVYGLPAGKYTVDVNGIRETFTLDVDNKPAESPGTKVPWEEARQLILGGEVQQVTQLHSLEVILDMQDGRRLVTTEPAIDAVFQVVDACGEPCADMVLATE